MRSFRLIGVALMAAVSLSSCADYGEGDKTGTITRFTKQGFTCKTWEGTLAMDSVKFSGSSGKDGGTSRGGNAFDFTVLDESLIDPIKFAMQHHVPVVLHYHQAAFNWHWCRQGTPYVVESVQEVK